MDDLKGKKIAVLGAGVEGKSAAAYITKHGGRAEVFDEKDAPFPSLIDFDLIFRSPGVSLHNARILEAVLHEKKITSTVNFFLDHSPTKNIIGVTGAKGKGTTATLIHLMLQESGKKSFLGGNIGTPPLDFIDDVTAGDWVVLELSSFQLIDATKNPHIAVVLMITSEHLDWHSNTNEYIKAKAKITTAQTANDIVISNIDYEGTKNAVKESRAKRYDVSTKTAVGTGSYIKDDSIVFTENGKEDVICETDDVKIPGKHNLENACAAVCAAKAAGVPNGAIATVLKTFKGLEFRLETVAEKNGVTYINDSFSTNPDTTIAAIRAFGQPKILILGGSGKNSDFTELGREIANDKSVRAIVQGGKEWERIKEAVGNRPAHIQYIEGAQSMKEIVWKAASVAQAGDVVLLSPACASFDMFENYKERGKQFKEEVLKLP